MSSARGRISMRRLENITKKIAGFAEEDRSHT